MTNEFDIINLIRRELDIRQLSNQMNPSPIPNHTHNGTDSSVVNGESIRITRILELKTIDDQTLLTTGDGKLIFCIPKEIGGYNLTNAQAFVSTVSSSGTPTIQIANITKSVDILTTKITIDASEFTSYTATTPSVVNTANNGVDTGNLLRIDVDVAGTGAKGLGVILTFTP